MKNNSSKILLSIVTSLENSLLTKWEQGTLCDFVQWSANMSSTIKTVAPLLRNIAEQIKDEN